MQHLMNSPFHSYDQGTADGFAEGAELAEEDAPPEPDHKPTKWGWKEDKQWRAGPYEASWGKGGGKGGSGGSSSSTALAIAGSGIVAAVARAEAAARTAARMAHAAASAFEAEASILRDSLDSLQKR